jgi:hypothetical protein
MKKKSYGHQKGFFKPRFPHKYAGDPTGIVYRSSLEWKTMRHFDSDPNIIKWASEERWIPYRSPVDGKIHKYYVDFVITVKNENKQVETIMVEVKPATQCRPPYRKTKKVTQALINETMTWGVNQAKWAAAREYAERRGWRFEILTDDHILGKK